MQLSINRLAHRARYLIFILAIFACSEGGDGPAATIKNEGDTTLSTSQPSIATGDSAKNGALMSDDLSLNGVDILGTNVPGEVATSEAKVDPSDVPDSQNLPAAIATSVNNDADPGPSVIAIDRIPDRINFLDIDGVMPNIEVTSETITITGLEPNYSFNFGSNNVNFLLDAGTDALTGTFEKVKTVTTSPTGTLQLAARVLRSNGYGASTGPSISINQIYRFCEQPDDCFSATWHVNTKYPDIIGEIEGEFGTIENATAAVEYISETITIVGLEPNYTFNFYPKCTTCSAWLDVGTHELSGQFRSFESMKASAEGTVRVALKVKAPSTAGATHVIQVGIKSADFKVLEGSSFTVTTATSD